MNGHRIKGRRILVDVERGRTVKGWKPRKLAGGLGGRHYTKAHLLRSAPSSGPLHSGDRVDRGAGVGTGGRGGGGGGGFRGKEPFFRGYRDDRNRDRDRDRDRRDLDNSRRSDNRYDEHRRDYRERDSDRRYKGSDRGGFRGGEDRHRERSPPRRY